MSKEIEPASALADRWAGWCGEDNRWVQKLREFGALGGLVQDWGGRPQSRSAIPLTFALYGPDGTQLPCSYRLKDIVAAIEALRAGR